MGDFSSYLFAMPSFSEGTGRILDFGDTLTEYNTSPTVEEACAIALSLGWRTVGRAIRTAMSQLETEVRVNRRDKKETR